MTRRAFGTAILAAGAALVTPSLAHAGWTRTYVIEWIETAAYFGATTTGSSIREPIAPQAPTRSRTGSRS